MPSRPTIPLTVWMLGLVSLLMDISSEMVQVLLPLYLVSGLGASVLAVGLIEGISVAIATLTKLASGLVIDRFGRMKPLAVLGYGLGALSRLIFPLAVSVDQIVLAKALDRVGKGIRGTPRDALITGVTPPEIRGAAFGLRKSLDTLGGFLGPVLAVLAMLAFAGDIITVFWLAAIPAALAMLTLILGVTEPTPAAPKPAKPFRLAEGLRLTPALWQVIGIACIIMLARFSEAFLLLKALTAGFSPIWMPLALVLMHAIYGLAAWPVGKLSDQIGSRGLLLTSLIFLIAAHLVLAYATSLPAFLVGTLLWGLHMGFSQGLLGAMVARATPDALKGSAFGSFNLITGLTLLIGNILAGWLWQAQGAAAPFLTGAALSLMALILITLTKPRI